MGESNRTGQNSSATTGRHCWHDRWMKRSLLPASKQVSHYQCSNKLRSMTLYSACSSRVSNSAARFLHRICDRHSSGSAPTRFVEWRSFYVAHKITHSHPSVHPLYNESSEYLLRIQSQPRKGIFLTLRCYLKADQGIFFHIFSNIRSTVVLSSSALRPTYDLQSSDIRYFAANVWSPVVLSFNTLRRTYDLQSSCHSIIFGQHNLQASCHSIIFGQLIISSRPVIR